MEHRRLDLPGSTRRLSSRLLAVALLAPSCLTFGACAHDAAPATTDSGAAASARQVGPSPTVSTPSSPLVALRDSAAALDARYQSERTALNDESRALDSLDRRTAEYARRFDAWRRRARVADSLRVARDRLRMRLERVPR